MKKLLTILTIAVVSLSFTSCRQEDDSTEFVNNTSQKTASNRKADVKDTIKSDSVNISTKKEVDPDPPVKDGTRW